MDAICFVMGERPMKLRAKKASDLAFGAVKGRPTSGKYVKIRI